MGAVIVGDRVMFRRGLAFGVGSVRYVEAGAAVVKWDGLHKVYSYDIEKLTLAPVEQPNPRNPTWAIKLQRLAA